jgi:hypothetical protein
VTKGVLPEDSIAPLTRVIRGIRRPGSRPLDGGSRRPRGQQRELVYLALRRLLQLLIIFTRSDGAKEIELLALRHEVAMLLRRVKSQSFEPADYTQQRTVLRERQ